MKPFFSFFLLLFCLWSLPTKAQPATIQLDSTTLTVSTLITNLDVPWEILWGPDNYIWMTERGGLISRINPDTGEKIALYDIPDCYEQQESGLLGMVLHPDFANNPYVYVVYNYLQGGTILERLVRYTYNGTTLTDQFVLIEDITGNSTHVGSRLIILPDTTLLMTTGDAQNQPAAQDLNSNTGKFLRMNLDGSVPADNPFPNSIVYSFGHRNAQGVVRSPSGIIYSSEHGPTNDDEINIITPGRNYGWPTVQGFCNTPLETTFCTNNNVVEPLLAWTPTIAPGGVDYYDHPAIPEWRNAVLMCVLKNKHLKVMRLSSDGLSIVGTTDYLQNAIGRIRDICQSPDGRVFLSSSNRDAYGTPVAGDDRIIVLTNLDYVLPQAAFTQRDSCLTVQFDAQSSINATSYLWNFGDGYTSYLAAPEYTYAVAGTYTVSLTASNSYGSDTFTSTVTVSTDGCDAIGVNNTNIPVITLSPNPMLQQTVISYPNYLGKAQIEVFNTLGQLVFDAQLPSNTNTYTLHRNQLTAGVYYMVYRADKVTLISRLVVVD